MTISWGQLLREARQRARLNTLEQFADALAEQDISYSPQAIGQWENDRRSPYSSPELRENFLQIVAILVKRGGFTSPTQVNDLLHALDRTNLTPTEEYALFSDHSPVSDWDIPALAYYDTLIGREADLAQVTDWLTALTGSQIVCIVGLGGIGKTALAQESLQAVRGSGRYEALAWQTAKSTHWEGIRTVSRQPDTLNIPSLMRHYLNQLMPGASPTTPEAIESALREALHARPCLLILDNLETVPHAEDAVKALRKVLTSSRSRALLTSRERLTDTDGVAQHVLKGLARPASDQLIRSDATRRGLNDLANAPDKLLGEIYAVTEGMPLALKLIVAEVDFGIALDEELKRLRDTVEKEDLYGFLYQGLWKKLSETAKLVLVGAGTFAAPALRSVLMQTCELDEPTFNRAVPELVRASLLDPLGSLSAAAQRYAIHAMTRWFVNGPLADAWAKSSATDL